MASSQSDNKAVHHHGNCIHDPSGYWVG